MFQKQNGYVQALWSVLLLFFFFFFFFFCFKWEKFWLKTSLHVLPWPKKSLQPRYSWGWSAVRSCDIELRFDIDATHSTARRELALQIEVDVAWYHMIALRINLMNISAVTIFFGQGSMYWVVNTVEPVLATTWQKRPPENCGHTISVP